MQDPGNIRGQVKAQCKKINM